MFNMYDDRDDKEKLNDKLDRLIDPGIRYFFSSWFYSDFKLKRDLDLAADMREQKTLERQIFQDSSKIGDASGDSKKYSILVSKINDFISDSSNQHVRGSTITGTTNWNSLESNVLDYFNSNRYFQSGIPICKYYPNKAKTKGYSYETDQRILRYFDGTNERIVCKFSPSDGEEIKKIFPALFDTLIARTKEAVGLQKSMKIQPQEFIKLVTLAKNTNDKAAFHVKVDKPFISLFNSLQTNMEYITRIRNRKDMRTLDMIVSDITNRINEHVDSFEESVEKRYKDYKTDNKVIVPDATNKKLKIMKAIKEFLNDGDFNKLEQVVKDNKPSFFEWLFYSSKVDKSYAVIKRLNESKFFADAIKQRQKFADNAGSHTMVLPKFNLIYIQERSVDSQHQVKDSWKQYKVSRDGYRQMLDNAKAEVLAFKAVIDQKGLIMPTLSRSVLLRNIEIPSEIIDSEDHVIGHIINEIDYRLGKLDAGTDNNNEYETACGDFQNIMNEMLAYRFLTKESTFLISEDLDKKYDEIGEKLIDVLDSTRTIPKIEKSINITIKDLRGEIDRLLSVNKVIEDKLSSFITECRKKRHYTLVNELLTFQGEIAKRNVDLNMLNGSIYLRHNDEVVNLSKSNKTHDEDIVAGIVDHLNTFTATLTNTLNTINSTYSATLESSGLKDDFGSFITNQLGQDHPNRTIIPSDPSGGAFKSIPAGRSAISSHTTHATRVNYSAGAGAGAGAGTGIMDVKGMHGSDLSVCTSYDSVSISSQNSSSENQPLIPSRASSKASGVVRRGEAASTPQVSSTGYGIFDSSAVTLDSKRRGRKLKEGETSALPQNTTRQPFIKK